MKAILSILLLAFSLSSCIIGVSGNGDVKEVERQIMAFNEVDVSGNLEIVLMQGEPGLKVIADENLHELIETEVQGDRLIIRTTKNIRDYKKLEIYLSSAEFEKIEVSGAVSISSNGTLRGDDLELGSSGAADVKVSLDYDDLSCELSGASELELKGSSRTVSVRSSGASNLKLFDLEVRIMRLDLSGASEARINVSHELSVEASGASMIRYRGSPKITKTELSGASSINPETN